MKRQGPLSGYKVLDLTWIVGGPVATRMLASLGADVIKIESSTRAEHANRGSQFRLLNADKRSCGINLKSAEGKGLFLDLAATADLVVENFSPGTLDRLGIGFEELATRNQGIVLVSLSGLGQSGPYRDFVSYGSLIQSFSGWSALVCPDDELADDRLGMVPVWADYVAGVTLAIAAVAALVEVKASGLGMHLEVTVLESLLALLEGPLLEAQESTTEGVLGNKSRRSHLHDVFRCSDEDGWVAVVAVNETQVESLRSLLGIGNDGELREALAGWASQRTATEAAAALRQRGVPSTRSQSLWDLMADPDRWARGLFIEVGGEPMLGTPWRFGRDIPERPRPAPPLGAHTREVLEEIGLSSDQLEAFEELGIVETWTG